MRRNFAALVAFLVLILLPVAIVAADHEEATTGQQEEVMVEKVFHLPAFGREFTGDLHGFAIVAGEHRIAPGPNHDSLVKGAEQILVRFYGGVEGPWPDVEPTADNTAAGNQPPADTTPAAAAPPDSAPAKATGKGKG